MMLEAPTVSIQNGRAICLRISSDNALSSSEKNGFGKAGGSGPFGAMTALRLMRSAAIRVSVSPPLSWGKDS